MNRGVALAFATEPIRIYDIVRVDRWRKGRSYTLGRSTNLIFRIFCQNQAFGVISLTLYFTQYALITG